EMSHQFSPRQHCRWIFSHVLLGLLAGPSVFAQVYSYNDSGRLARATDASGVSVQYFYDETGNLASTSVTSNVFVPKITAQPGDFAVVAGQSATFSVAVDKTANMTYQWQKDGVNIAG